MKAREERQKVMIRARMRSGVSWHDVCILNLSRHGIGLQCSRPPGRGTYVELRRGQSLIIARVAWTKGHRAGLRSQDPILVNALLGKGCSGSQQGASHRPGFERRQVPRTPGETLARSRGKAQRIEFTVFGLIACAVGFGAVSLIEEVLARPLAQIRTALR